jgi:transposase InsO family protein
VVPFGAGDRHLLAAHVIRCSMSRKGEYVDDVIDYNEMCYNSWRKHSYLGYVNPNEYETFGQVA